MRSNALAKLSKAAERVVRALACIWDRSTPRSMTGSCDIHCPKAQHGRDQLHTNWPDLYTPDQEATLPAEELLLLKAKGDYGWPECYYDPFVQKLILAPEYGGDGKTSGVCANKTAPAAVFPAHWAPNAMVRYDLKQFPQRYHDGVFIAFHGSWNRAPYPQGGYNVVFQPLAGDHASG